MCSLRPVVPPWRLDGTRIAATRRPDRLLGDARKVLALMFTAPRLDMKASSTVAASSPRYPMAVETRAVSVDRLVIESTELHLHRRSPVLSSPSTSLNTGRPACRR